MLKKLNLLLAALLVLSLVIFPYWVGQPMTASDHSVLPFALLGACGGLVRGLGFDPINKVARFIFDPKLSAALMVVGAVAAYLY